MPKLSKALQAIADTYWILQDITSFINKLQIENDDAYIERYEVTFNIGTSSIEIMLDLKNEFNDIGMYTLTSIRQFLCQRLHSKHIDMRITPFDTAIIYLSINLYSFMS